MTDLMMWLLCHLYTLCSFRSGCHDVNVYEGAFIELWNVRKQTFLGKPHLDIVSGSGIEVSALRVHSTFIITIRAVFSEVELAS